MQRIVTRLPLADLWNDAGSMSATKVRELTGVDIRELLQAGPVRFVVANVAAPLRWVPANECFRYWKNEVQSRVADASEVHVDNYPGGYCYFASEWAAGDGPPVVLLSVTH